MKVADIHWANQLKRFGTASVPFSIAFRLADRSVLCRSWALIYSKNEPADFHIQCDAFILLRLPLWFAICWLWRLTGSLKFVRTPVSRDVWHFRRRYRWGVVFVASDQMMDYFDDNRVEMTEPWREKNAVALALTIWQRVVVMNGIRGQYFVATCQASTDLCNAPLLLLSYPICSHAGTRARVRYRFNKTEYVRALLANTKLPFIGTRTLRGAQKLNICT